MKSRTGTQNTRTCALLATCSVTELESAIYQRLASWNHQPKPFVWRATADVILDKVRRCKELTGHHTKSRVGHPARVYSYRRAAAVARSKFAPSMSPLARFALPRPVYASANCGLSWMALLNSSIAPSLSPLASFAVPRPV